MSVISLTEHTRQEQSDKQKKIDGTVYLPIAPQTVARTRFSPPPPPQSHCLMLPEAMDLLDTTIEERGDTISLVAIAGPGDPFATPDITLHAITQIRNRYPDLKIGLRTHGLGAKNIAADLAHAGADSVVVQVNGVRAAILEKLYAWIRPGPKTLKLATAVELLLKEQRNGVPALKFHDLAVQIQTTVYPGYNSGHIPKIASEMLELGADTISLLPYESGPDVEVALESPSCELMSEINAKTSISLKLAQPMISPQKYGRKTGQGGQTSVPLPKPSTKRRNVAVASSNGMEVDLHLGHALRFLIYGPREDGLNCLLESRDAPEPGSGKKRWAHVAETLSDCFVLLVASAGETPRKILAESGLKVLISEENIEGTVDALYGGGKKKKM